MRVVTRNEEEKLRVFGSKILGWIFNKLGWKPRTDKQEREEPSGWS